MLPTSIVSTNLEICSMQYLYKNYTSEFIQEPTKYSKYYFLIIERALNEIRSKLKKEDLNYVYYENHHIIPKSINPTLF
jgi:hypothetical protein